VTGTEGERRAEEGRYRRVRSLGNSPAEVPTLLAFLGDPSWRVRKAAVAALGRLAEEPTLVPALIAGLASSDNAGLRGACAEALVAAGVRAVPELTGALATPDPGHRRFILEVLGSIGNAGARDALVEGLSDADLNVRTAAAEALGRIGGEEAIRPLVALASAKNTELLQRLYIFDALVTTETKLEYDTLAPWIGEAGLERQVLGLLGLCGDPRAVTPLLAGIEAPTRTTRAVAICAMAELIGEGIDGHRRRIASHLAPGSAARQYALEFLDDPDDAVLDGVLRLLGATCDVRLAPQLVAASACRPVVETGHAVVLKMGPAVVLPLLDSFDNAGTETRVLILEIIEELADAEVVPTLLEIAAGPDTRATEAALRVVGRLGGVDAIDSLMDRVRASDSEVARAAAMALAGVGSRTPGVVAEKVAAAFVGEQRPEWLLVLGALARADDLGLLVAATRHREAAVRCAAIEAARVIGPDFPEETLTLLLTDESPQVRAAACRALAPHRSDATRDALLAVARDTDPWVVAEAVRSLRSFRGDDVAAILADAAASTISPIAIAALRSLFSINPPGLESVVARALRHADPEVVREAVATTMRLSGDAARDLLIPQLSSRFWNVRAAAARALANRRLEVPVEHLQDCLLAEEEPLALEALELLLAMAEESP
jgi:HEAT repeat protein